MIALLHGQPWWYVAAFAAVCATFAVYALSVLVACWQVWADERDRKVMERLPGIVKQARPKPDPALGFLPVELDAAITRRDESRQRWADRERGAA